ncbi:unnamed protein product [Brassica oleracea var. botrytis]|uniref:(rape) hypothetical protein n=1 Tax=Brassica napus TaxID=3708 RepID=A0A078IF52_BRANA|nr:unnamed protein product [Brassica napus]CDY47823.1 BnaC06g05200D [Brassica napus]
MAQKLLAKGGTGGGARNGMMATMKNEEPKAGSIHGGSGQSFTESFDLNHTIDEHIVSIKCYYDEGVIQGLVIKTNIGTSALMGYNLGTTFKLEVKGKKIIGFHGSSDKNLRSLGAYFAPISPANLILIGKSYICSSSVWFNVVLSLY